MQRRLLSYKTLCLGLLLGLLPLSAAMAEPYLRDNTTPIVRNDAASSQLVDDPWYDPWENWNRASFAFNRTVDRYTLKPAAKAYRWALPEIIRYHLRNFFINLEAPLDSINAFLQGDLQRGGDALTRFMVNSSFGVLGLFDVAGAEGVERVNEDFGQTLAVWGMESGPYIMLPFLGPSSVRDTAGRGVDWLIDPVGYAVDDPNLEKYYYTYRALDVIDARSRSLETVDSLEANAIDFYAAIRNLYFQRRANDIANVKQSALSTQEADDAFGMFSEEDY